MVTFILAFLILVVISWSIGFRDTKTAKYPTKLPTKEQGRLLIAEIDHIRNQRQKVEDVESEIENTKRDFEAKQASCNAKFKLLMQKDLTTSRTRRV